MLELVKIKELDNIIRIGESVKEQYSPGEGHGKDYIKNKIKEEHYNIWKRKVTHGFLEKKLMEDTTVDRSATNQWLKSNMLSHVEGYLVAMQEQEINTKDALKRKEKNLEKKRTMNNSCRLCHKNTETLFHITTGCPEVSSNLYLNIRHNAIAKVIFQSIINKRHEPQNLSPLHTPKILKYSGTGQSHYQGRSHIIALILSFGTKYH